MLLKRKEIWAYLSEEAQPENSDVETGEETSKLSVHIDTPVTSKHSSLHEQ